MRYLRASRLIQHVRPTHRTIRFRFKCNPRIVVTVPAEMVHEEDDAWCILYVSENQCLNTIVMSSREWTKEG